MPTEITQFTRPTHRITGELISRRLTMKTMNTTIEAIDTRVLDQEQMSAYLQELTREQREGILYQFAAVGRPQPSEDVIELIAQAEGMGYTYDVETSHFEMGNPEEHDFLFWNIPVVGTVDSESGLVKWGR